MKRLSINIIAIILLCFVSGCQKDEFKIVAKPEGGAKLEASETVLNLVKEQENELAISFQWTPADFGYAASITNVLQIGLKGTDFAGAKEVNLTAGALKINYTTLEFNNILLALELPVEEESELEVRVKSSISPTVDAQYSNVLSLTATPYAAISYVYVPGAYQNWVIESAERFVSPTSNGIYSGIIQFPEIGSMFKITQERNWDNAYGEAESGVLVLNGGIDIASPMKGNVEVTVNTNTLLISYKLHSWGLIGDATPGDWVTDTPMKFNNQTQTWSATVTLKKGGLKFRKNNDWGTNYGVTDGVFTSGGDDISITEQGIYTITLDVENEEFTLSKN